MNPVWLLSGFLGDHTQWGAAHEELEKHLGYTVDWYDWAQDCRDVKSLPEAAQVISQKALATGQRPVLVGYSMGGRVALEAITSYPGVFEQAVLTSTHLGLTNESEKKLRLQSDEEWAQLLERDPDLFWQKWSQQEVLKSSLHYSRSHVDTKLWASLLRSLSTGKQKNFRDLLSHPTLPPMLFITGARDEKFVHMHADLPEYVNRVVIEDAGHRVPLDQPVVFAQNAAHFIRTQWEKL
jgi:2-succinyl-6-hydroxy-2,4-cyclohexadiene-1-carboxylate synthase